MAKKNKAAVALGKLRAKAGDMAEIGRAGGSAKVPKGLAMMSPERRKEIAAKAAAARWAKKEGNTTEGTSASGKSE